MHIRTKRTLYLWENENCLLFRVARHRIAIILWANHEMRKEDRSLTDK